MAGSGRRVFTPGEVLTASNVMNYLQDQAVMVFPDSGARGSAIGSAVSDGMVSYLADSNSVEVYKTVGTAVAGWESNTTPQSPNAIINGAFEINQRGFSSTTGASLTYGFDRWGMQGVNGTVTHSLQTFTTGAAPVAGQESTNFARIVTSGQTLVSAAARYYQPIENVRTFAGQTVTVSFWARAGSGTPKIAVEFYQDFGSGGSPSAAVLGAAVAQVTLSTSWARYYATVNIPSISGKTIGTTINSSSLGVSLWVSAGSDFNSRTGSLGIQSNTFDFWGVQVEAGSTATPFRRNANSLQGELAACQRYYWRQGGDSLFQTMAMGWATLTTNMQTKIKTPVSMRATPTSLEFSGLIYFDQTNPGVSVGSLNLITGQSSKDLIFLGSTVSGATQYRSYDLAANNNINAFLGISAEL